MSAISNHDLAFDQQHIWHPYSGVPASQSALAVSHTDGHHIVLANGQQLIDGMSSWWAAIHGYNHPKLIQALKDQADTMAHIMFGGLTHQPAIDLAQRLIKLTPNGLDQIFFADSGSVAMEVALKMAMQYWHSQGQVSKQRFVTPRHGYHGDTLGVMSVCDPDNGMHSLFHGQLASQWFVTAPPFVRDSVYLDEQRLGNQISSEHTLNAALADLEATLAQHHQQIAAVVLEPLVQGAGGIRVYDPQYLIQAQALAKHYQCLFIVDEIATGFGRTGYAFVSDCLPQAPDILAVGKALTGGMMTLAATLTQSHISHSISQSPPYALMHGPTFMANPLACAVANASIDLWQSQPWQTQVQTMAQTATQHLADLADHPLVQRIQVQGSVIVVELNEDQHGSRLQQLAIEQGIWIRPFGKLAYMMPAYNLSQDHLHQLLQGVKTSIQQLH